MAVKGRGSRPSAGNRKTSEYGPKRAKKGYASEGEERGQILRPSEGKV